VYCVDSGAMVVGPVFNNIENAEFGRAGRREEQGEVKPLSPLANSKGFAVI